MYSFSLLNIFYGIFYFIPSDVQKEEAIACIKEEIQPAYKKLKDFVLTVNQFIMMPHSYDRMFTYNLVTMKSN